MVGEHVIAEETLTGGDEGIGVDESTPSWVVISALEVIQTCLPIVYIATVAQWVVLTQCGCMLCTKQLARIVDRRNGPRLLIVRYIF